MIQIIQWLSILETRRSKGHQLCSESLGQLGILWRICSSQTLIVFHDRVMSRRNPGRLTLLLGDSIQCIRRSWVRGTLPSCLLISSLHSPPYSAHRVSSPHSIFRSIKPTQVFLLPYFPLPYRRPLEALGPITSPTL